MGHIEYEMGFQNNKNKILPHLELECHDAMIIGWFLQRLLIREV